MLRESWLRVRWSAPRAFLVKRPTKKRLWWGWDSEAIPYGEHEGKPILFVAVSESGQWFYSPDPLEVLAKVRGDVFVWNITYEIGAFLKAVGCTKAAWEELRKSKGSKWVQVRPPLKLWVRVFPARYMGVRYGKRKINFYDAYNFFGCSLDKAARDFLGESKKEFDFEWLRDGIEKVWDVLVDYCRQDASLTVRLMLRLYEPAQELGFERFNSC